MLSLIVTICCCVFHREYYVRFCCFVFDIKQLLKVKFVVYYEMTKLGTNE